MEYVCKGLRNIDTQLCSAFAVRCAMRALPFLVADKYKTPFIYWRQGDRIRYLTAIFQHLRLATLYSTFEYEENRYIPDSPSDPLYTANQPNTANTGETKYASYVISSIEAAFYANNVYPLNPSNIGESYRAADFAIKAASAADKVNINHNSNTETDCLKEKINAEMNLDLQQIRECTKLPNRFQDYTTPKNLAIPLFKLPLWSQPTPETWQQLFFRFSQSLLEKNVGFEVWINWYQDRIDGVPLNQEQEEQWLNIPPEIREQGVKATNAYLASLTSESQKNTLQPLNLVRAIFIGNGAVGKTSLIHRLQNEPVVEGKEPMTAGIEIREWPVPDSDIKARFWDFGGQVMSHSTHQFFLRERCLYVLVVDAGTEREKREQQTANEQAEYWLEHVKAFGNAAPVILVGNKADTETVKLDMHMLSEKYPNIVNFYPVSCTKQDGVYGKQFKVLKDVLSEQLKAVGTHQIKFTNNQFTVLNQIRTLSRTNAFLNHDEFDDLCKHYEIGKIGLDQQAFLGLLDSLGEIIHFPDLEWADAYMLNPRWLTYGVYTLLYSDEVKQQQGLLSNANVIHILQSKVVEDEQGNQLDYPKDKCRFITDAMTKFQLCYCLPDNHSCFVIPDKLPEQQPDLAGYFDKTAEGTLALEYVFTGLLPRSVMPNLIVARHQDIIKNKQGKQLVWQRGVIIQSHQYQSTARLQVDYQRRTLQLWVQGKEPREYLVVLRDEINRILNAIKGLSVKENVLLPDFARINPERFSFDDQAVEKATYKRLIEQAKAGQTIIFSDSGNQYDLHKVMGFIMTDEQQKKEGVGNGNIINNNYAPTNFGAQSAGNNNEVTGKIKINLSPADTQHITELQESLGTLMQSVDKHDADFAIKADAYAELKLIREQLENLENASPETKNKLLDSLTSIKDGSLGAFQLVKDIKENEEAVGWLVEKAAIVSAVLSTLPS